MTRIFGIFRSVLLILIAAFCCNRFAASALQSLQPSWPQVGVYHNTDTGRFWTQDSYEGNGSDPASLHKYTFNQNNPVNRFDPSGHESLGEVMVGQAVASMCSGALANAFLGAWGRLWSAAGAGTSMTGAVFNSNAIADDANSGALWGLAGFGVGKAAFWAVGKAAPYLLEYTPTFSLAFNRATAQLSRAWQTAETAWANVEQQIVQGTEASLQLARNAAAEAEAQIAAISDRISQAKSMLGWGEDITVAKNPISIGHWPDYIDTARFLGTRPFEVPPDVWAAMGEPEKWAANQLFLDRAMARGDSFFLSTPLRTMRIFMENGDMTGYGKEIQYLLMKSYRLSSDGRFLVPPLP